MSSTSRALAPAARVVLVATAYFAGARLGYAFAIPGAFVTLWPPAGITLALLLLSDRRDWPTVAAGALLGSIASDLRSNYQILLALLAALANVGESLFAAWAITRRIGSPVRALTVRVVVEIALTAAIVTNAATSFLGALMLQRGFGASLFMGWLRWFVGDGVGMVTVAPLIVAWYEWSRRREWPRGWRLAELSLLFVGMALTAHFVFGPVPNWFLRPGAYTLFPFLLWAGLRFGTTAAASASFMLATYAIWNAGLLQGPIVVTPTSPTFDAAAQVYAFLLVTTLCALVPAAALKERRAEEERRRDIESRNRENEARYRTVVETATDAIVTIDERSTILFANPAAAQIFGYTNAELVGSNLSMLMPERLRDRHRSGMGRYLATARPSIPWRSVPLVGLHKDGREIPLEVSFGDRVDGHHHFLTGVLRDVSEREAAAATLRAVEEQFRQSQKMEAVGQLAGGIAHDFNNLLTAIVGYASLIETQLKSGDPIREDLAEITSAADRAAALTRQLLAFSRRQILEPRVIDLTEILASMAPMLRRLIGEHIDVVVRTASDVGHVLADPTQIEQVLLNLSVNARDAMPDGGTLTLEVQNVDVALAGQPSHPDVAPGSYVMLAVSDTGVGMDANVAQHAFEPFFTTKPSGKGTGLGLATVHGIVQQSGGYIWLYSEPGRGTTFKVFLPRTSETGEPIAHVTHAIARGGTETILLTEDDEPLRRLAQRVLERRGYSVLAASTPSEALTLANENGSRIDLLVTDVIMPEMNGRALAEAITAMHPSIRVLYMSGYTDDAVVRRGVLEHGVHFIQKPFDPELLAGRVRETLDAIEANEARSEGPTG